MMRLQLVVIFLTITAGLAIICNELGDGIYGLGCDRFITCANGVGNVTDCPDGQVFDSNVNKCDIETNVGPPCGLWRNCTNLSDGSYPYLENNCRAYYTCKDGDFRERTFCPNDLVWDEKIDLCNAKRSVCPPCGNKSADIC